MLLPQPENKILEQERPQARTWQSAWCGEL